MKTLKQFIRFGIVGISNTLLSYVLYACSLKGFEHFGFFRGKEYLPAQAIAFVLSVLWSFFWNRRAVFTDAKESSLWKSLAKTYLSYALTGLVLSSTLLYVWIDLLGIGKMIAPLLNLFFTVPLNFLLNKYWAFR